MVQDSCSNQPWLQPMISPVTSSHRHKAWLEQPTIEPGHNQLQLIHMTRLDCVLMLERALQIEFLRHHMLSVQHLVLSRVKSQLQHRSPGRHRATQPQTWTVLQVPRLAGFPRCKRLAANIAPCVLNLLQSAILLLVQCSCCSKCYVAPPVTGQYSSLLYMYQTLIV